MEGHGVAWSAADTNEPRMTRTVYSTATSLDGFIADPNQSLDWLFDVPRGPDHPDVFAAFFDGVGAVAMGSHTFEWVVRHEGMRDDPERWDIAFDGRPCWVFSSRDLETLPGRDITFVSGDVDRVHEKMATIANGADIWLVGGGELVGSFVDAGLVDQVHLTVQPVLLGSGAPVLSRRLTSELLSLRSLERAEQEFHAIYDVVARDDESSGRVLGVST